MVSYVTNKSPSGDVSYCKFRKVVWFRRSTDGHVHIWSLTKVFFKATQSRILRHLNPNRADRKIIMKTASTVRVHSSSSFLCHPWADGYDAFIRTGLVKESISVNQLFPCSIRSAAALNLLRESLSESLKHQFRPDKTEIILQNNWRNSAMHAKATQEPSTSTSMQLMWMFPWWPNGSHHAVSCPGLFFCRQIDPGMFLLTCMKIVNEPQARYILCKRLKILCTRRSAVAICIRHTKEQKEQLHPSSRAGWRFELSNQALPVQVGAIIPDHSAS